MKYFSCKFLPFFWVISVLPAVAGEMVKQSLIVPNSQKLYVEVTRGFVKVEGWDKSEILLQGELDDSVEELIFKNKGEKSLIKIVTKGNEHWGDETVVKIFVPKSTRLFYKGVKTSYHFSDIPAGISGGTISGDIHVKNVHTKVQASSVSGGIFVENSSGEALVESVNGDIDFSGAFEQVQIKSMSGNVTAKIDHADRMLVKNVSGDIFVEGSIPDKASVELNSVSGDIRYKAVGKLNAQCELESIFGGEISNSLTADEPKTSMMQKQSLNFVSGDGSGKLIMSTVSGSISVEKES